jgi:hypothetical protein
MVYGRIRTLDLLATQMTLLIVALEYVVKAKTLTRYSSSTLQVVTVGISSVYPATPLGIVSVPLTPIFGATATQPRSSQSVTFRVGFASAFRRAILFGGAAVRSWHDLIATHLARRQRTGVIRVSN